MWAELIQNARDKNSQQILLGTGKLGLNCYSVIGISHLPLYIVCKFLSVHSLTEI